MPRPYCSCVRIQFSTEDEASMVKQSLEGDDELQPTKIDKEFDLDGNVLVM